MGGGGLDMHLVLVVVETLGLLLPLWLRICKCGAGRGVRNQCHRVACPVMMHACLHACAYGPAGPFQLSNVEGEHFQRGQLDVFELDGAPDCGQLRRIEVEAGGSGRRRAGSCVHKPGFTPHTSACRAAGCLTAVCPPAACMPALQC